MSRIEGWEAALAAAVEEARARPYRLGRHDCALWAAEVVRRVSGRDVTALLRGRYASRAGALRLQRELAGGEKERNPRSRPVDGGLKEGTLQAAVTAVLGLQPAPPALAARGDPVLYREPGAGGEEHLGICVGAEAALLAADGLEFRSMAEMECCWKV